MQPIIYGAIGVLVGGVAGFFIATSQSKPEQNVELIDLADADQVMSYYVMYQTTSDLTGSPVELNATQMKNAIDDVLSGAPSAVSNLDIQDAQTAIQQRLAEANNALVAETKAKSAEFLETIAQKDGVTVLESGLILEPVETAEGPKPTATDRVTVHYHGTLIDGTVFDSSVLRDAPATFALNRVISGWTEGLQHMTEGSKYKFYIPSDLAYGDGGNGDIPGGSALIFEVELIEIVEPAE